MTNLFRESYLRRKKEIKSSLRNLSEYLESVPDYSICLYIKVASFIPLLEKITPDDTIKIHKRQKQLRIDYTLIGYSFLQAKRRKMSCIIEKDTSGDLTIISVNHDQGTYMDFLEDLSKEEIILIIEDLLCTDQKRTSPKIIYSELTPEVNIFNTPVRQSIG